MRQSFQTVADLIFPPRCLCCGDVVEGDFGLCGSCWRDAAFIGGTICDTCGTPLPGEAGDTTVHCDSCLRIARPWQSGRAALLYSGTGRRLVLALKHNDRQEIARPAAAWMARALGDKLPEDTVIAPVPLHWGRLLRRRYNQSALLARALAPLLGREAIPDLLHRQRRTQPLKGKSMEERFAILADSIHVSKRWRDTIRGRPVLLVDDVMTSGATFSAAAEACLSAGSGPVRVVALARVDKAP